MQVSYFCPDGWSMWEYGETVECIMLGGVQEVVTKVGDDGDDNTPGYDVHQVDASILCDHHGGWVVDMSGDQLYTQHKNSHIKYLITGADDGGVGIPGLQ